MFAHIIPRRQAWRTDTWLNVSQTQLSIAIALACFSMQTQAAQVYNEIAVADANIEAPQALYERSDSSSQGADYKAVQTKLFIECTQVQTDAARLACFDTVATRGQVPNYTMDKQPLDLIKTLKTTISGKPKVVLADNVVINGIDLNADTDAKLFTNQSATDESLDTVGLTRSEAQVLEDVGVTQNDIGKYTPLSLAYDLDKNSERGTWTVRPHQPNYVLPLYYTFDPNLSPSTPSQEAENFTSNDVRNTDLKFQLSIKSKVGEDLFNTNADLWFGYTQQAHWQVYNEDNSRPFRATDYQPEIFLTQPVTANLPFGGRLRMLGIGAIHHSNGRSDPISRSWNRAYLMAGAEWGKFSIVPRVWARIDGDGSSDDNPDIEDFMGYGDVKFSYNLPSQQSVSGTLRYNPSTNKGAAQIDYVYPLTKNVNGYVQLFQGYGESIIDYNYENTAIGFGIVLSDDWKGL